MAQHRLQKIISNAGYCSRRKAEVLIDEGRVKLNGKKAGLGDRADPELDSITIDGKPLAIGPPEYYAFNKPVGYITALKDHLGRPTVKDLNLPKAAYHVGRLDKDTEGLLILTTDGDLANIIMSPKYGVQKTYIAVLNKRISGDDMEKVRKGVRIDDRKVDVSSISVIGEKTLEVVIHEGRKRIVRRLFDEMGYRVVGLKRTKVGPVELGKLRTGEYRKLKKEEIDSIRSMAKGFDQMT